MDKAEWLNETTQKPARKNVLEEPIDVETIFATQQVTTQKHLEEVFVGYYWVDLDGLSDDYVWQSINDRPLDDSGLLKLLSNFKTYGVLHCDKTTAIPAGLRRSWILSNPSNVIDGLHIEDLPELQLTDEGSAALKQKKIFIYGGNHRRNAQKAYLTELRERLRLCEADLKKLKRRDVRNTEESKKEIDKRESVIATLMETIAKLTKWAVAVFDLGERDRSKL
jgi:hypothetical protein